MPTVDRNRRKPLATLLAGALSLASMVLGGACSTSPPAPSTDVETAIDPAQAEAVGDSGPAYEDLELERRRDRVLIDELAARDIDARPSARGVVVTLPDVLFEFGSEQLKGEALRRIADVAAAVNQRARGRRVAVEGHTDSIGAALYNQGLSERRARSVADALVEEGVSRSLVSTRGYGSMFPIEPNTNEDGSDSPAGRARNRRVEIVILD